ncbi:hypothetical protein FD733_04235 [Pantoea sp. Eser]|nr:hypothetical protein [Pantoea sp. Eser]
MLKLQIVTAKELSMPEFFFFRKGRQLVAADRKDTTAAERLKADGYQKQFEEIIAPDAEGALIRLQDIRKDAADLEYGFLTGGIFDVVTLLFRENRGSRTK